MKKKLFFTGSVFQFYVPEIKKYAFCKYFDFTHISSFHGLLAQVFNKFSESEENNFHELNECDWLFGPRSMHKWPNLRKETSWKSLGILSSPNDTFIPDFKGAQAPSIIVEDESKITKWFPVHNLTERGENCSYSQIKHLENKTLTTASLGLSRRTGMEFCRINNLNVANYYDLSDEGIRSAYWQMINVPIYRTIAKEIRGKSII
ncbi:MAG: hypothetical protein ABIR66_13400 [Saprospiraceae bacterium]